MKVFVSAKRELNLGMSPTGPPGQVALMLLWHGLCYFVGKRPPHDKIKRHDSGLNP